jgi:hypothetical protein
MKGVLNMFIRAEDEYLRTRKKYSTYGFNRWLDKNWGVKYHPHRAYDDELEVLDEEKYLLFLLRFSA